MPSYQIIDGQGYASNDEGGGSHRVDSTPTEHEAPGTVITSGRTEGGTLRSAAELGPKDVISVAGGETSVAAALNARLVSRMADGSLVVNDHSGASASPSQGQESGRGEGEGDDGEAPLEAMGRETETLITQAAESGEDLAVQSIIADVSKGVDASDDDLGKIATRLQMEPEAVRENYQQVRDQFAKQAYDRVAKDTGLDGESILAWGWENAPGLMQEAIRNHLNNRSTGKYQAVAKEYLMNLDTIDPDGLVRALQNNGYTKVEKTRNGKILLEVDGSGQVEYRAAIRGGIIFPAGL